jgi:hypothetical protein
MQFLESLHFDYKALKKDAVIQRTMKAFDVVMPGQSTYTIYRCAMVHISGNTTENVALTELHQGL